MEVGACERAVCYPFKGSGAGPLIVPTFEPTPRVGWHLPTQRRAAKKTLGVLVPRAVTCERGPGTLMANAARRNGRLVRRQVVNDLATPASLM